MSGDYSEAVNSRRACLLYLCNKRRKSKFLFMILLPRHTIKAVASEQHDFIYASFLLNIPHKKCKIVGIIDIHKNKSKEEGRKSSTKKEFMLEDFRNFTEL